MRIDNNILTAFSGNQLSFKRRPSTNGGDINKLFSAVSQALITSYRSGTNEGKQVQTHLEPFVHFKKSRYMEQTTKPNLVEQGSDFRQNHLLYKLEYRV